MRNDVTQRSLETAAFLVRLPLKLARAVFFLVTAGLLAALLSATAGAILALPFAVAFGWDAIVVGVSIPLAAMYCGMGPQDHEQFVKDVAAAFVTSVRVLGRLVSGRGIG